MKKVIHITTGLNQGGAESVLCKLCEETQDKFSFTVISLTGKGFFSDKLHSLNIPVYVIDFRNFFLLPISFFQLYNLIKKEKPNLVQTWMYHADFFGGLVAKIVGIDYIIWNIRGPLNSKKTNLQTHILSRLSAIISKWVPNKIVSCSEYATKKHIEIGYQADKFVIIPNGYKIPDIVNINSFNPVNNNTEVVLGMIARYDPYKDHETLLKALRIVKDNGFNYRCLLAGSGIDGTNEILVNLINSLDLNENLELLGVISDVNKLFSRLHLHVLSSIDEAFPNVIAESMAMGVPTVTTNVGDAALIVGDLGWIVNPSDSHSIANGIIEAIREMDKPEWIVRKDKSRQRIIQYFSIEKMCKQYINLWTNNL